MSDPNRHGPFPSLAFAQGYAHCLRLVRGSSCLDPEYDHQGFWVREGVPDDFEPCLRSETRVEAVIGQHLVKGVIALLTGHHAVVGPDYEVTDPATGRSERRQGWLFVPLATTAFKVPTVG